MSNAETMQECAQMDKYKVPQQNNNTTTSTTNTQKSSLFERREEILKTNIENEWQNCTTQKHTHTKNVDCEAEAVANENETQGIGNARVYFVHVSLSFGQRKLKEIFKG